MIAYSKSEKFYSEEEYLARERNAETKSEYFSGRIYAMAGASRRHNLINVNVTSEIRNQLKGRPCEVYTSDMRLHIPVTGLYTYPDVLVVCGRPQIEPGDNLTNPRVIIEILSPSTARYDRGGKFAHYQTLESLTDYILISQHEVRVNHYVRGENNEWLQATATQLESVLRLDSIDCDLALAEVYDKVDFSQEAGEE
jgi:Uma2 family endonuclease